MSFELVKYDAACKALAEAVSVDEVKDILDVSVAMKILAKRAKNEQMEIDAIKIRMDATRRLGQMIRQQKESIGLAPPGRPKKIGSTTDPISEDPESPLIFSLAEAGIDKHLAHEARNLERLSEDEYKERVQSACDSSRRTIKKVVSEVSKAEKAEEDERKKIEKDRKDRERAEEKEEIDFKNEEHGTYIENVRDAAANVVATDTSENDLFGSATDPISEGLEPCQNTAEVKDNLISDTEKQSEKQEDKQSSKTEVGLSEPVVDFKSEVLNLSRQLLERDQQIGTLLEQVERIPVLEAQVESLSKQVENLESQLSSRDKQIESLRYERELLRARLKT